MIISKLLLFESVIIAKLEGLALRASTNLVGSLPWILTLTVSCHGIFNLLNANWMQVFEG